MRSKILIIVSSALLSACAVGPDFKAPQSDLPQQWQAPTATNDAVEREWWKQSHDATLDDLVARALTNNAQVQLATLRLAAELCGARCRGRCAPGQSNDQRSTYSRESTE